MKISSLKIVTRNSDSVLQGLNTFITLFFVIHYKLYNYFTARDIISERLS